MTERISTCSIDENGNARGGKAGDQNGREFYLTSFYVRPWNAVYWYPQKKVRRHMARKAKQAAENDAVGYNQDDRYSFYNELMKAKNYAPKNITKKCNADCSSAISAIIIATGKELGIQMLADFPKDCTTYNLDKNLLNVGFKKFTGAKHLNSAHWNKKGAVYNSESHTVTQVDRGSMLPRVNGVPMTYLDQFPNRTLPTVPKSGKLKKSKKYKVKVKKVQKYLNWAVGTGLEIDGIYGDATGRAVKTYRKLIGCNVVNQTFNSRCFKSMETFTR